MKEDMNIPEEKSQWLHKSGAIYTVEKITNKQAIKQDYPITVVYSDVEGNWWSHPLEYWHDRMKLINPNTH